MLGEDGGRSRIVQADTGAIGSDVEPLWRITPLLSKARRTAQPGKSQRGSQKPARNRAATGDGSCITEPLFCRSTSVSRSKNRGVAFQKLRSFRLSQAPSRPGKQRARCDAH